MCVPNNHSPKLTRPLMQQLKAQAQAQAGLNPECVAQSRPVGHWQTAVTVHRRVTKPVSPFCDCDCDCGGVYRWTALYCLAQHTVAQSTAKQSTRAITQAIKWSGVFLGSARLQQTHTESYARCAPEHRPSAIVIGEECKTLDAMQPISAVWWGQQGNATQRNAAQREKN